MKTVDDVMTRTVVVVSERAPYKEIVRLMEDHRVSALPVITESGRVVGIVSEADLLLKEEYPPLEPGRAPLVRRHRAERAKASASVAEDLMTREVITIRPSASLTEAARVMHRHGVKRLPVVGPEAEIVGIVSRRDLLKVFLRDDAEILLEVRDRVLGDVLVLGPSAVRAMVHEGTVYLDGTVEQRSLIPIIVRLVHAVDGVVAVDERLQWAVDDLEYREGTPYGVLRTGLR
jgi:CBS domain-containing protein